MLTKAWFWHVVSHVFCQGVTDVYHKQASKATSE